MHLHFGTSVNYLFNCHIHFIWKCDLYVLTFYPHKLAPPSHAVTKQIPCDTILPDTTERVTFLSFTGVSLSWYSLISKTISKNRKSYKFTIYALLFTFKRFLSEEKKKIIDGNKTSTESDTNTTTYHFFTFHLKKDYSTFSTKTLLDLRWILKPT